MRNKLGALLLVVALLGVFLHAFLGIPPVPTAEAQSQAALSGIDTWSGQKEHIAQQPLIAAGSIALVDTGVAGSILNIRALTLASSAAVTLTFYDGSAGTGATQIGSFYLAANTVLTIPEWHVGQGLRTKTAGNGIYMQSSGAANVTYVLRVKTQSAQ